VLLRPPAQTIVLILCSASWFDGPIANSSVAARLKKVGITTPGSCGVASSTLQTSSSCYTAYPYLDWAPGTLIEASQAGCEITFFSFTYNGTDESAPVDTIAYTLQTPACTS
jgi:hypothetical protein